MSLFTIKNKKGSTATFYALGATLVSLKVPSISNDFVDVVLGFDTEKEYLQKNNPSIGCIVGRIAGRIGNSSYTLNSHKYTLRANNGKNHLHSEGMYSFVQWKVEKHNENSITFSLLSKEIKDQYCCDILNYVTYTLTNEHALIIDYEYKNLHDKLNTIQNITNHSYFNLSKKKNVSIKDHMLYINAQEVTETNEELIPTGKMLNVSKTLQKYYDFTKLKKISNTNIDICYSLLKKHNSKIDYHAYLYNKSSGIEMKVKTNYPGIVIYTSIHFDGTLKGKNNVMYGKSHAICFECQGFPDAINRKEFPSVIVKPKETKKYQTIYAFSVKK